MACRDVLADRALVRGPPLFTVHHDLPATLRAAGQARRLVAATLATHVPALSEDTVYRAQVVVSELVTNAVLHARTELYLGISGDAATLLITVADGAPAVPAQRAASLGADYEESGRGMTIVASLADDFGWRRRADGEGKIMWVTLALTTSDRSAV